MSLELPVHVLTEGIADDCQVLAGYVNEEEAKAEVARLRELNKSSKLYFCRLERVLVKVSVSFTAGGQGG